jgi:hypothetical protein
LYGGKGSSAVNGIGVYIPWAVLTLFMAIIARMVAVWIEKRRFSVAGLMWLMTLVAVTTVVYLTSIGWLAR